MEKAHGGEASTKLLLTEEDVSELRKYIVEMMHSELESMENIKQNEGNDGNNQILKELVVQERSHFKTLKAALEEDTKDLELLEEKRIGKVEKKLKAKRKKFRLKAKNEMRSLKRRMSFITSELERGQMANEDALSLISALGTKREEFEQSNHILQLSTVLQDVNSQTLAAKQTAGELDSDLASLLSTIEEQESQGTTLRESLCAAKGRSKKLQANSRALQRKTKDLIKNQVKLRRQNDVLLEQENELCHELHKAERLSQILAEGIKYGTNCARQLDDSKAHSDKKQEQMELNLRNQEIKRQQQSACEKALFQAEVAAWDAKVPDSLANLVMKSISYAVCALVADQVKNVERQLQEL
ncbi:hypothetical protein PHYBOEH_002767 [Phytophthora boehmeriae]|uniref:Uncharacterized protein n=1 Tax=Phytophthora boehmeriae TaxID=109152 RepID=A0A8T1WQ35_9STRA|nr:hypothetical protein PHYBOEH_002767 [Phytophthora boehmeriae]